MYPGRESLLTQQEASYAQDTHMLRGPQAIIVEGGESSLQQGEDLLIE